MANAVNPRRLTPFLFLLACIAAAATPAAGQDSAIADARPTTSGSAAPAGDPVVTPPAGSADHERLAPRTAGAALQGEIGLDGVLDEAAWRDAPVLAGFVQRRPDEGAAPSQRTEVRFLFDDTNLYVGARMYDGRGAEGVTSRLVRRDGDVQSDQLRLTFDTFLDHQGETVFSINPAGVKGDAYGPAGSYADPSWDPVWRAETRVDSLGWTAELAIPFSQLRFPEGREQRWGLQIERYIQRLNEQVVWSYWPLNEQGGPSRFGHLEGIEAPPSGGGRLELLPYAVTQLETEGDVNREDPFASEREAGYRVGVDLKYLLTSNLTLNAAINPDFGQAEVDPAVVNLSAFETFFPEKREFFVANRGMFDFGSFWCFFCSNVSSLDMLFTRRIGRSPQAAGLAQAAGEHADVPDATTILGAAKITGQVGDGYTLGVLNAVTDREHATVVTEDGSRSEQEVEPLSNYFVGRLKRDYMDGDLQVGGMLTSVARDFGDPLLESRLNAHSEAVGLDAEYWWGDRTYHLLFSGAVTQVAGSEEAMVRAQRSSARYFQRPDRRGGGNGLFTDRYDSTLTSMRGYGMYARVAKDGGDLRWEGAVNIRSPGFENNDIAFLTRADYVWTVANVNRRWTKPTSWYRELGLIGGFQHQWNFDGDLTSRQVHGFVFWEAPFYWNANAFVMWRPSTLDDRLTRGGPVVRGPGTGFASLWMGTDHRKPVIVRLNPSTGWNEDGARDWGLSANVTVKPASNVQLSLGPSYDYGENTRQYLTAVDDPTAEAFFGRRYVFSDLEQRTLSMNTRLNVTFSPTMTLELFAQPFISSADFSSFKEFDAPRRMDRSVYGEDVGTIRAEGEGFERQYTVDPDGAGPAEEFTFSEPDFTVRSLRGNLVFRWEYLPGSTLFFVWTQDRNSSDPFGEMDFGRDRRALFAADPDNVFLLKMTYWLGL